MAPSLTDDQDKALRHLCNVSRVDQSAAALVADAQRSAVPLRQLLNRLTLGSQTAQGVASAQLPLLATCTVFEGLLRFLDAYAEQIKQLRMKAGLTKPSSAVASTASLRRATDPVRTVKLEAVKREGGASGAAPLTVKREENKRAVSVGAAAAAGVKTERKPIVVVKREQPLPAAAAVKRAASPPQQAAEAAATNDIDPMYLECPSNLVELRRRISAAAAEIMSRPSVDPPIVTDHLNQPNTHHHDPNLSESILHADDACALRRRQTLAQVNALPAADAGAAFQRRSATALPAARQEQLLIDELLNCLVGCGGSFVQPLPAAPPTSPTAPRPRGVRFAISEQINCSLRALAAPLLATAHHYTIVNAFCVQHSNEYHGFCVASTAPPPAPPLRSTTGTTPTRRTLPPPPRGSQIVQALAATMRQLLQEYTLTICTLEAESSRLTLAKLLHLLRPTGETLAVMAAVVGYCGWRGAELLSWLHEQIEQSLGNAARQAVFEHLLEAAARPYVETLQRWIVRGVIVDPHKEFMVDVGLLKNWQDERVEEEMYWRTKYVWLEERTPSFLRGITAENVMRTGKYLNVIEQCRDGGKIMREESDGGGGGDEMQPVGEGQAYGNVGSGMDGETLHYSATSEDHLRFIDKAYSFASARLLHLLVGDNDLMGHLASVRRYLLMQQGDFIDQFMDVVDEELSKNVDLAMPTKLEQLLGMVLRTTSAKDDRYIDQLRVHIYDCDLQAQMGRYSQAGAGWSEKPQSVIAGESAAAVAAVDGDAIDAVALPALLITGYEGFSFDYEVRWPVSLVLSRPSLIYYKSVFRLLFYLKHTHRQLGAVWIHNKNIKRFERGRMADVQRLQLTLSHRMTHAVQNIEYYMLLEVVEPLWVRFQGEMERVKNVDDVIAVHGWFVDALLNMTMLRQQKVLDALMRLCRQCLEFGRMVRGQTEMLETEEFGRKVSQCNAAFTDLMNELLGYLNLGHGQETNRYANLVHRLNYNNFYSFAKPSTDAQMP